MNSPQLESSLQRLLRTVSSQTAEILDRALCGKEITVDEATRLFDADGSDLLAMIAAADMENPAYQELLDIEDIGPSVSADLVAFFTEEHNRDELYALENALRVRPFVKEVVDENPLTGKTVVFTGTMTRMSRAEAKRRFTLEDHLAATAGVECRKDAGVIDETPMAYKDIDAVMAAQADLVEVVHTLKQVVCIKG